MSQLASWEAALWPLALLIGAMVLSLLVHYVAYSLAHVMASRTTTIFDESLVRHTRRPTRFIFPLVAVLLVLPTLALPAVIEGFVHHAVTLALIGCVAWLLIALTEAFNDLITHKYEIGKPDNLEARKVRTKTQMLRRISVISVVVTTFAIMLMTFPGVRQLGISLFASAGVAGLVIGIAARPALSNLLAGAQIALTEPIRLDDVVVVEGEWGRIEEIGSTYVVVRIWDLRRLVLPLSYFIDHPFQNWTRVTADVLGTVFLHVDYSVPVEAIRQELHRILLESGMWDGKVWNLQVTDATEHTVQLRALISAPESGIGWDLRCHVREKLIEHVRNHYPGSLPRMRAELQGGVPSGASV